MENTVLSLLVALPFLVVLVLLPDALAIALQVWLCKRKNRWLGLILPMLSLLLTLPLALNTVALSSMETSMETELASGDAESYREEYQAAERAALQPQELLHTGGILLVANIPTVVLGGIWLHYRNRRDFQEEIRKMNLQDLE